MKALITWMRCSILYIYSMHLFTTSSSFPLKSGSANSMFSGLMSVWIMWAVPCKMDRAVHSRYVNSFTWASVQYFCFGWKIRRKTITTQSWYTRKKLKKKTYHKVQERWSKLLEYDSHKAIIQKSSVHYNKNAEKRPFYSCCVASSKRTYVDE